MNRLNMSNIFFILFKDKDELSLEEAYSLGKRDPLATERNRWWIGNKLAHWRKNGVVEAIYGSTGALAGVKLTERGRTLLRKPEPKNDKIIFLMDVMMTIFQLRHKHPEYEITFEIKLKENKISIQLN